MVDILENAPKFSTLFIRFIVLLVLHTASQLVITPKLPLPRKQPFKNKKSMLIEFQSTCIKISFSRINMLIKAKSIHT